MEPRLAITAHSHGGRWKLASKCWLNALRAELVSNETSIRKPSTSTMPKFSNLFLRKPMMPRPDFMRMPHMLFKASLSCARSPSRRHEQRDATDHGGEDAGLRSGGAPHHVLHGRRRLGAYVTLHRIEELPRQRFAAEEYSRQCQG